MILSIICVLWILNSSAAQFTTDDILKNIRCHGNSGNFCDSIVCAKLSDEDCLNGEIVPNSSFCNCCDACIETKAEGHTCEKTIEGTLKNIIQPRCKKGLQCIDGICSLKNTTCLQEKKFRLNVRSINVYSPELWIPECAEDGNYSPKQTKTKRSICVDNDGKRIFGLLNPMFSENMTCGCSRYYEEIRKHEDFLSEPQIHCSPSGDYDEVQCIGDSCYCADPFTGSVKSRIVKIKYLELLKCSWKKSGKSEKSKPKGYIKPCEVEIIRIQKLKSYFRKKGLIIEYTSPVNCDPDGSFHPVQCNSEICACTNTEGLGIGSYFVNKRDKPTNMTCSCARDSILSDSQYDCTGYGNYEPIHCFSDDICYCVDKDGDLISGELNQKLAKSTCHRTVKTLQTRDLRDLEETVTTTTTTEETVDNQTDYVYDYSDDLMLF